MPWININGSRIIFLLAFTLFLTPSCQKDQSPTDNGITIEPPIIENPVEKDFPKDQINITSPEAGHVFTDFITEKEVREIIKLKELLRALIKESLVQLLFNHNFNPLMPEINTRMACVTCTQADCGCPFQDPDSSNDPDPGVYPKTISLKYYEPNAADCTCILATSPSGLAVTGEMILEFSADFTTGGHSITIKPQDDFTVDGHDIDADEITITQSGSNLERYNITTIDNVVVTKDGVETKAISIDGGKSRITITDVNNNHGSIDNAFGLLDDIFTMRITNLVLECGNGEQVIAQSTEDLIYDMTCDNIQDGIVEVYECSTGGGDLGGGLGPGGGLGGPGGSSSSCTQGALVATYDYGAPAGPGETAVCDDEIDINTD